MHTTDEYTLHAPAQLRELLIAFRKQRKLTQAALAEQLGISQQSYAQVEANPMATSVERLYTILRLLDVELKFASTPAKSRSSHTIAYPNGKVPLAQTIHSRQPAGDQSDQMTKRGQSQRPDAHATAPAKLIPPTTHKKDRW